MEEPIEDFSGRMAGELPTLRDRFAMSAMTGLAARDYRMGKSDQAEVVKIAYAIADQMIETRKK